MIAIFFFFFFCELRVLIAWKAKRIDDLVYLLLTRQSFSHFGRKGKKTG